eukprot:5889646-Pyramimonas_sp.AAC.1
MQACHEGVSGHPEMCSRFADGRRRLFLRRASRVRISQKSASARASTPSARALRRCVGPPRPARFSPKRRRGRAGCAASGARTNDET